MPAGARLATLRSTQSTNREVNIGMASVTEGIEVKVPLSTAYNQWTQFEDFPRFGSKR